MLPAEEHAALILFGDNALKPHSDNKLSPPIRDVMDRWMATLWRGMSSAVDRQRGAMKVLQVDVEQTLESEKSMVSTVEFVIN